MSDAAEPVTGIEVPISLSYEFTAGVLLLSQKRKPRRVLSRIVSLRIC